MQFEFTGPQNELEKLFGGHFCINAYGKIESGDDEKFRKFLSQANPPPRTSIYIDSSGGNVEAALRVDVRQTTTADIDWNYSATSTGLESNELPATATGSRLDQNLGVNAAITHDFGGIEGRLRLGLARSLYGDVDLKGGGKEDNSDRNYTQASIALRGALNTGGVLQPFVEAAYQPRIHDKKFDKGQIIGGLLFGIGWAITGACPGPLFAQIGSGFMAVIVTLLSAIAGTFVYGLLDEKLPH